MDGCKERKVWYQFWDTCLTNERSYLARLRGAFFNVVNSFPIDKVQVFDEF